ncbi:hypothetical protein Pth03_18290 [Planotetraspora thailandica]|uniref:Uncharacterized protein n=1 Tax=Planotetraspora thailandica TaxID=487172 RepID=A0A8J3UZF5_9ACTN|nr:hypothetical protein [Planotetraspora thailandica]GII53440.1 hypothetical protein Pth03_18290 [Planotetraspora thailandica]
MGPELQYQMIINRVADLRGEAAAHRLVREAKAARKARERSSERRQRGAFGKLDVS